MTFRYSNKYQLYLFLGLLIAAVPGFLTDPYSINFFDEPYQILNALEWKNAVYSPLASWLGHLLGNMVEWKYVAFRYLASSLHLAAMFVCGFFALNFSKYPKLTIIVASLATLFMLLDHSDQYLYNWDSWSAPVVSIAIVTLLSYIFRPCNYKIFILSLTAAVATLLRLPNASIIPLLMALLAVILYIKKQPLRKIIAIPVIFLSITLLILWLIFICMYGSIDGYLQFLNQNEVNDHSLNHVIIPFFKQFIFAGCFSVLTYFAYKLLSLPKLKGICYGAVFIVITVFLYIALTYTTGEAFGSDKQAILGINLLIIAILSLHAYKRYDYIRMAAVISLFLLTAVPAVGSNGGYMKALAWPVLPILVSYGTETKISTSLKSISIAWILAFLAFCITRFYSKSFFDESLVSQDFKFKETGTVLDGMHTDAKRGELLLELNRQLKPYIEKGYRIIPLRYGNKYMWEYMTLTWNKYQRHKFSNLEAFDDEEYVHSIENDLHTSQSPCLIVYMYPSGELVYSPEYSESNPVEDTAMLDMLGRNASCVLTTANYSLWTYP